MNRKPHTVTSPRALLLGAAVLMGALLGVPGQALAGNGPRPGNTAPEFSLKALDGAQVSLSQLRQHGHVLLVFWAAECVYCYSHIKDFNALHARYQGKGLTVAAINIAGEYDVQVAEYVQDNQLKYRVLSDRLKNIDTAETYGVVGTRPHHPRHKHYVVSAIMFNVSLAFPFSHVASLLNLPVLKEAIYTPLADTAEPLLVSPP